MTTATGEKLGQTGVQDDYGQALAEGEITRLLKTVQAAQFKKSENLAKQKIQNLNHELWLK
ncbi:MAG: hypothetical protein CM15mP100_3840 [Alphaproteobacteria bacterium]|nr:MAG: hypothetical protein CM15mP100_3840 [Alphaproteobacteria bacterium]